MTNQNKLLLSLSLGGMGILCANLLLPVLFTTCNSFTAFFFRVVHVSTLGFLLVFLATAVLGMVKFLLSLRDTQLLLNKPRISLVSTRLHPIAKEMGLLHDLIVLESRRREAFCFGLFSPKVYISSGLLNVIDDERELRALLAHEMYHVRHGHVQIRFLVDMLFSVLSLFPALTVLRSKVTVSQELLADAYAVSVVRSREPLIGMLKKLLTFEDATKTYSVAFDTYCTLEPRIQALLGRDERVDERFRIVGSLVSTCLFLLVLVAAATHTADAHGSVNGTNEYCKLLHYSPVTNETLTPFSQAR